MAQTGVIFIRRLHIIVLSIFIIPIMLLGSCNTTQVYEGYIPSLDDATISRLITLLEEDDPLQVLQDIDTIKRMREPDDTLLGRLSVIEEEALEDIIRRVGESLENEHYHEALALYRSLEQLGAEHPYSEVSEQSILLSAAVKEVDEGRETSGLMLFFKAASIGHILTEDIRYFGQVALEEENPTALRHIALMLTERGEEVPAEYSPVLDRRATTPEMIAGTVTIWVNRGMKLEGGVGYPERVIGSGFFIDKDGYIITNYHVISSEVDPEYEGYSRLYVRLPNNPSMKVPAEVVGWNRVFDIALLKTELEPDYVFMFEDGVTSSPGDTIFAIGSPAGLESTITSGIVSAKDRDLLQMGNAIQVDVPINQGNSGGPLLDKDGKLVGIVFAGIEQFEGVNFGIPSEWLFDIIPLLFRRGEAPLPWIGAMTVKAREGLEVMYVVPGSPAYRAGLSEGDIITRLAGRDMGLLSDAHHAMLDLSTDTLVKVRWLRQRKEMEGVIKLAERPYRPMETAIDRDVRENLLVPLFGMRVEKSGKTGLEQNYIVRRIYPGFTADEIGLSPNDPFSIRDWVVEKEEGYAAVRIRVKKRKAGFIESVIQIATYLETAHFI